MARKKPTRKTELLHRLRFNPCFAGANECRLRYRILKGSAGSGKSANAAQDFIVKLMDQRNRGANLLVVRKVDNSHQGSTFAELQAAARRACGPRWRQVWKTRTDPPEMECVPTGARIWFRGMNDEKQREKVKSIQFPEGKLTWIWIEEATELLEKDFDMLDDRLRGRMDNPYLYYQMTLTLNPVSAAHWIKARFFDNPHDDVFTHHSTYLDNRFIDPAFHKRMEARRLRDPEGYRIYGLGEWGEWEGLVFTHFQVHGFETGPEAFDDMAVGMDFGYHHPNATLTLGIRDGEIYICDEMIVSQTDTAGIIRMAEGRLDRRLRIYCDSAEPDRILTWQEAGYRAVGAQKPPGSVRAQIDWLKQRGIHIHPRCTHTLREIQSWKWRKDPASGAFLDDPESGLDDAMAALRYGIEGWRRAKRFEF